MALIPCPKIVKIGAIGGAAALVVLAAIGLHAQPVADPAAQDVVSSQPSLGLPDYQGVWRTVDRPQRPAEEGGQTNAVSRHDMVEILRQNAAFGERPWSLNLARGIKVDTPLWDLEFSFKPLRMIWVDLPTAQGAFQRKQVWYLVYRVRNLSADPVPFAPRFLLETHEMEKVYLDRILPVALRDIAVREDQGVELKNTAEIAGDLAPSTPDEDHSLFGVVTWTDVDPRTNRFSIYVEGLTNAYRWDDPPLDNPEAQPVLYPEVLQLNFWRPGDDRSLDETEIRFGIPDQDFLLKPADFLLNQPDLGPTAEQKLSAVARRFAHISNARPAFPVIIESNRHVADTDELRQANDQIDAGRRDAVTAYLAALGVVDSDTLVSVADPQEDAASQKLIGAFFDRENPAAAPLERNAALSAIGKKRIRGFPGAVWVYAEWDFLYKGIR
jgi:hypothetical protein